MVKEWLARGLIVIGLALVAAFPVLNHMHTAQASEIEIHARMAENGGWMPSNLTAIVGEPLHLRLTSDDVTHGFAIGMLDQPAVEVRPGEMMDISVVFNRPGTYTFYCTRWCGVNHWRMRGTIDVRGPQPTSTTVQPPLYVALAMDIDDTHQASVTPAQIPSAARGALMNQKLSPAYLSQAYYLSHTPENLWQALRTSQDYQQLSDMDIWDLVAWVWKSNTTSERVQAGKGLFAANCAACHGENGAGDGIYARQLASGAVGSSPAPGEHTQRPADFTDPLSMLSASPAHLQGKILRGGMGTGMPSWGAIFTQDQTWALVAYLWSFQFEMEVHP
jgi:plastocyanin